MNILATIPVCLAMGGQQGFGDHNVSCATATLRQVMRIHCERGFICPAGGFSGRAFLLPIGRVEARCYWPTVIGRVIGYCRTEIRMAPDQPRCDLSGARC